MIILTLIILTIFDLVLLAALSLLARDFNNIKKQLPKMDKKGRFTK